MTPHPVYISKKICKSDDNHPIHTKYIFNVALRRRSPPKTTN